MQQSLRQSLPSPTETMSDRKPEPVINGKSLSSLRVVDLRQELEKRGMSKSGNKNDLIDRLRTRLESESVEQEAPSISSGLPQSDEPNDFVKAYLAEQQQSYQKQIEIRQQVISEAEAPVVSSETADSGAAAAPPPPVDEEAEDLSPNKQTRAHTSISHSSPSSRSISSASGNETTGGQTVASSEQVKTSEEKKMPAAEPMTSALTDSQPIVTQPSLSAADVSAPADGRGDTTTAVTATIDSVVVTQEEPASAAKISDEAPMPRVDNEKEPIPSTTICQQEADVPSAVEKTMAKDESGVNTTTAPEGHEKISIVDSGYAVGVDSKEAGIVREAASASLTDQTSTTRVSSTATVSENQTCSLSEVAAPEVDSKVISTKEEPAKDIVVPAVGGDESKKREEDRKSTQKEQRVSSPRKSRDSPGKSSTNSGKKTSESARKERHEGRESEGQRRDRRRLVVDKKDEVGDETKSKPKRKWGSGSDRQIQRGISSTQLNSLLPKTEKVSVSGQDEGQAGDAENMTLSAGKFSQAANGSLVSDRLPSEIPDKQEKEVLESKPVNGQSVTEELVSMSDEVPIARNPASNVLFIENLTRPFTLPALHSLLKTYGNIDKEKFWTDKIKSMCLVAYGSVEEAEAARSALWGMQWPSSNPKKLVADFSTEEEIANRKAEAEKPVVQQPAPISAANDKYDISIRKTFADDRDASDKPVRDWDREKLSSSPPSKRSRRSPSPVARNDDKKAGRLVTPEPEGPAKLLDDLFKKTSSSPVIYWLPLNEGEAEQRMKLRQEERERRRVLEEKMDREPARPARRSPPPQQRMVRSPRGRQTYRTGAGERSRMRYSRSVSRSRSRSPAARNVGRYRSPLRRSPPRRR